MWEWYARMKWTKQARVLVNTPPVNMEACIDIWMAERNSDVEMRGEYSQLCCRTEAEAPEHLRERLLGWSAEEWLDNRNNKGFLRL